MPAKTILSIALALACVIPAVAQKKTRTQAQTAMQQEAAAAKTTGCSPAISTHVYKPQRLLIYSKCVTVTGIIEDATAAAAHPRPDGVRKEPDGDTHGWLKLDSAFAALVNSGNTAKENGNLVYEIVCFWKPTQADAIAFCPASYHNGVQLAPVGSHVQITGVYVQDGNHQHWMEIHPVTRITIIP